MKKIFVGILLMSQFLHGVAPSNKEQIVIALDLHGVVFDFSYQKFVRATLDFLKKDFLHTVSLMNPFCAYRIITILNKSSWTAENVYRELTRYYPKLADRHGEFLQLCNAYELNVAMHELISDLKKQGYRIAVCSNIGEQAYHRFVQEYPQFFEHCEVAKVSAGHEAYMRKPAPNFFINFKQMCHEKFGHDDLYIVFADDKNKNIKSAEKYGIKKGHVFKNAAQFKKFLIKEIGFQPS